jgi:hypothetical protein
VARQLPTLLVVLRVLRDVAQQRVQLGVLGGRLHLQALLNELFSLEKGRGEEKRRAEERRKVRNETGDGQERRRRRGGMA